MGRVLPPFELIEPPTLAEAVALARQGGVLLAGGTAVVPALRRGDLTAGRVISLGRIAGLDGLSAHPKNGLRVGALVRAGRLLPDIWTGKRFAAIHEAIEQLDSPHVANMGTVVGNLCAAQPDHDMAVALIALDGAVEVQGATGLRRVALTDFYRGPCQTVLAAGEIVTALVAPGPGTDAGSAFKKLDRIRRAESEPGRISAAASVTYGVERERILDARIVLGGLAMPRRFPRAESMLVGQLADPDLFAAAATAALAEVAPISPEPWIDRTARAQALVLLRDAIAQANSRALARQDHFDDADDLIEESL